MIEISHQQAQQLVRDSMDQGSRGSGAGPARAKRIPQEQWAALQAHLENCAECREYARHLQSLEKDLARSLQLRFSAVAGPQPGVFRAVVNTREAAVLRRRRTSRLLFALGGMVVLALLLVYARWRFAPLAWANATPTALAAVRPTAAPTPTHPGEFRGLLAFEGRHEGNAEIYLLNAGASGGDVTNLTQSTAQDTSPAWSPDGEWVAFLSDRAGKNDVYVIHIAGSRLTRLTNNPNLAWQGPLSWSADGRFLSARGIRRDQGNEAYLYLVPLDGRTPLRSVVNSRGAPVAGQFSAVSGNFAFISATPPGLLLNFGPTSGRLIPVNSFELNTEQMRASGVFAWALGGQSLFYLSEGPYENGGAPQLLADAFSQVSLSPIIIDSGTAVTTESSAWKLSSLPGLGVYRSGAAEPNSLIFVTSQDSDQDGCWTLSLHQQNFGVESLPVELSGICLEGSLSSQSFAPVVPRRDDSWLVLRGRRPGQASAAFLAVRLPDAITPETRNPLTVTVEELGVPGLAPTENRADWPGDPQVRPVGARLNIQPYEVQPAGPPLAQRRPGSDLGGRLVLERIGAGGTALVGLRPNGGTQMLVGEEARPFCPVLSPDGQRIAYLARPAGLAGQTNLMLIPSGGGKAQPVTDLSELIRSVSRASDAQPYFGCPVWSPDGTRIVSEFRAGNAAFLALAQADGSVPAVYLRIEPLPVPPFWARGVDGNDPLLLVYPRDLQSPLHVVSVDLNSAANQSAVVWGTPAVVADVAAFPGANTATAFTASPDGKQIALVSVTYETGLTLVKEAWLNVGRPTSLTTVRLLNYAAERASSHDLFWLDDGRVGLRHPLPLTGSEKTQVELFEPMIQSLLTVARMSDETGSAAWSADGSWVFLGSESGLWVQDVNRFLAGNAAPARILADWVLDVGYRQ